jgi:hypothetical protein
LTQGCLAWVVVQSVGVRGRESQAGWYMAYPQSYRGVAALVKLTVLLCWLVSVLTDALECKCGGFMHLTLSPQVVCYSHKQKALADPPPIFPAHALYTLWVCALAQTERGGCRLEAVPYVPSVSLADLSARCFGVVCACANPCFMCAACC